MPTPYTPVAKRSLWRGIANGFALSLPLWLGLWLLAHFFHSLYLLAR